MSEYLIYVVILVVALVVWRVARGIPNYKRKFTDKNVVIVGASTGIGACLAVEVARHHSKLVLVSRSQEQLDKIKNDCEAAGAKNVVVVVGDVSTQQGCKDIIEEAVKENGAIDVLFLNAGIGMSSTLYNLQSVDVLERVLRVDFFGAMYTAYYALPSLRKSHGHIVVTSSAFGKFPGRGVSGYVAAKHALHGFFDSLRVEEKRNNIKVTIVCPGYVKTPVHDKSLGGDGKEVGSHKKTNSFAWSEVPLKTCVKKILIATALNETEVMFPFFVSVTYWLRTLLGSKLFDKYML